VQLKLILFYQQQQQFYFFLPQRKYTSQYRHSKATVRSML